MKKARPMGSPFFMYFNVLQGVVCGAPSGTTAVVRESGA